MTPPPPIWDPRNADHRRVFAALLKPFVLASQTKLFDDDLVALETVQAWIMSLADVPGDVLAEAFAREFRRGVTWMPRPGDLRAQAAAVVKERRREIAARAAAVSAECPDCRGSLFVRVECPDGPRWAHCECHRRGLAQLAQLPPALSLAEPTEVDA